MDSETAKLLKEVVESGINSPAWSAMLLTIVLAGLCAFLGAYLAERGRARAIKETQDEALAILQKQVQVTEGIKSEQAILKTTITEAMKRDTAVIIEGIKAAHAQEAFVRDLFVSIRRYAGEQAYALRRAYLTLYEGQTANGLPVDEADAEDRLTRALDLIIGPLRSHIGYLDEPTMDKIYNVRSALEQKLRKKPIDEFIDGKQTVFGETENARKFVKADRIAFRLGLIQCVLTPAQEEQSCQT